MNTVIAIVGPTAAGKTRLSLALAQSLGAEIVNGDSRQVYRGMEIGTGKPSAGERGALPHHLFDAADPDAPFSLAAYLDLARDAVAGIHGRGRPAILVGGTGQYVWALLEGWQVPHVPPDAAFRRSVAERAAREGAASVHAELATLDPPAAAAIHPHNLRRTIRALEVVRATGRPFSGLRRAQAPPWDVRITGLTMERALLDRRIAARVEEQVQAGWAEEVARLLARGYGPELPSFSSLGYREMAACVRGEVGMQEATEAIIARTRRFSHRQYAWFRLSDPRIRWLDATQDPGSRLLSLLANLPTQEQAPR